MRTTPSSKHTGGNIDKTTFRVLLASSSIQAIEMKNMTKYINKLKISATRVLSMKD